MNEYYILKIIYLDHTKYLEFFDFDILLYYLKPFLLKFKYNDNFKYQVFKGTKILNNDFLYGNRKEFESNEI